MAMLPNDYLQEKAVKISKRIVVREVGFEPTNPYGTGAYGQTHSLQACAFKSPWTL